MDRLVAMEVFSCVAATGSFSAAARRLNVGQPAVSKSVAQLEDRLGVALLVRTTRGLAPTEAGLNFLEHAQRAIAEAEEADLAARGAAAGLTGKLRVSAAVTFARIHLLPRIPEFLARHPNLELDVVLDDRNVDLVQERIDVALRNGPLADSTLTARKILTWRRMVLGTPRYFESHGIPEAPGDLVAREAVILEQKPSGSVWTFRQDAAEISVTLHGRLHVTACEGLRAAVLAHAGLTIAPKLTFAPEIADGTVKVVLADWELPTMALWAVSPAGRRTSAKAQTFVSFVDEILREADTGGATAE